MLPKRKFKDFCKQYNIDISNWTVYDEITKKKAEIEDEFTL